MEITWYGHSCFRLSERGMASVVTDPYDHTVIGYAPLKLKADIVTSSYDLPGHNYLKAVKGTMYQITGPGEYEVSGVFITGMQTNGKKRKAEELRNTLYVFDFDGLTIAHLGNLNRVPTQAEIESIGSVNIALVPVGGGSSLNASRASEVISLLDPNIVIPMHYQTPQSSVKLDDLKKFLKEMGVDAAPAESSYKVSSVKALPENTKVVVLSAKT